jgi:ParB family chromosome partitioning protein
MSRKVLGKGLGALISEAPKKEAEEPSQEITKQAGGQIASIDVSKVKPNKYQPRLTFDPEKLKELMASIKEKGVVQPIIVRPSEDGYELIAGERRLKAVRSLGIKEVPAVIREADDLNAMELSLIENIQREELNSIEEAQAYQRLIQEFQFTQEMVGQAVGKDRATITNSLRLLSLPSDIRQMLAKGLLSAGHAKVLLSLPSESMQRSFAKKTAKAGLSVRALEQAIQKYSRSKKPKADTQSNDMRMLEAQIQEALGTKVKINHGKKRGAIHIEYYSNEDLERILRKMGCL